MFNKNGELIGDPKLICELNFNQDFLFLKNKTERVQEIEELVNKGKFYESVNIAFNYIEQDLSIKRNYYYLYCSGLILVLLGGLWLLKSRKSKKHIPILVKRPRLAFNLATLLLIVFFIATIIFPILVFINGSSFNVNGYLILFISIFSISSTIFTIIMLVKYVRHFSSPLTEKDYTQDDFNSNFDRRFNMRYNFKHYGNSNYNHSSSYSSDDSNSSSSSNSDYSGGGGGISGGGASSDW